MALASAELHRSSGATRPGRLNVAYAMLAVLAVINLMNFMDRVLFSVMKVVTDRPAFPLCVGVAIGRGADPSVYASTVLGDGDLSPHDLKVGERHPPLWSLVLFTLACGGAHHKRAARDGDPVERGTVWRAGGRDRLRQLNSTVTDQLTPSAA